MPVLASKEERAGRTGSSGSWGNLSFGGGELCVLVFFVEDFEAELFEIVLCGDSAIVDLQNK